MKTSLTKRLRIVPTIFFIFFIELTTAQVEKFGKIDDAVLKMTQYDKDTSAAAIVLFDVGKTFFEYSQSEGDFVLTQERHRRIKIFKKSAYDYATVDFGYYRFSNEEEKIYNLKGNTFVLENGKVVKYKMEDNAIFTEKINAEYLKKKFTLPNVKEGAIIEYTYKIQSPFRNTVRDWYFQSLIPTLYSEYTMESPEYYEYKRFSQGYETFAVNESFTKDASIDYTSKERSGGGFSPTTTTYEANKIPYKVYGNKYAMKDVSAFKVEQFLTTPADYIAKIEHQLAAYRMPNRPVQNVFNSWESIAKSLEESESFGKQLKARGDLKDQVKVIIAGKTEPKDKINSIISYVRQNIKWNQENGLYTDKTLKKTFETKQGNIAELHLLLIAMLREAEINANPVIASTRSHGRVNTITPLIGNFNYVIAHIRTSEGEALVDITEPTLHPNLLPFKLLNNKALLIEEKGAVLIDLKPQKGYNQVTTISLKANEEGILSGDMQMMYKDYSAPSIRKNILEKGEEKYIEENWKDESGIFNIKSAKFENIKEVTNDVKASYQIALENKADADILYLDPVLVKIYDENPFKQENRKFPVDFGCPIFEVYTFSFQLPEGYQIDDIPKNLTMTLPDKSATFSYSAGLTNNMLQVRMRLKVDKTLYLPEEYGGLRELFTQLIAKQSEQIVLKKVKK